MTDTPLTPSEAAAILMSGEHMNAQTEVNKEEVETPTNTGAEETATDTVEAEATEEISEADPDLELQIDDEDAAETPSGDDVEDEGSDEAETPIEAPTLWDAKSKEVFAKAPREIQELLLEHETRRSKQFDADKRTIAEERKVAATEKATAAQERARLEAVVKDATVKFASRWDRVNWSKYEQMDPHGAAQARQAQVAEAEHLQQFIHQVDAAQQQAHAAEMQQFWTDQAAELQRMAEADNATKKLVTDPEAVQATGKYLMNLGIEQDRLKYVSAAEMSVANKARLYDELVAKQKAVKAAPKTEANTQTAPVRKRAPTAPGQPQSKSRLDTQMRRLSQTGSLEDAKAALMMMAEQNRQ